MQTFPTTYNLNPGPGTGTLSLPSQGSGVAVSARSNEVKFGDGYEVSATDGLNATPQTFNLLWKQVLIEEKDSINDFLTARKGSEAFLWTPPLGTQIAVRCKSWSWNYGENRLVDVRATFVQVFES